MQTCSSLARARFSGKKSLKEEGIEKLSGSRETGLDRLLNLDTGVVVSKTKCQFHRKLEQWPSELPHQLLPRHQTHKLARHPDAPVSHHLVENDMGPNRPGRSTDGVEVEMRARPPALKGFVIAGGKEIGDLSAGQTFYVNPGRQRKHRVFSSPATIR